MSQVIGSGGSGVTGHQLGLGPGGVGQFVHLGGSGDPNSSGDSAVATACVGSLYSRFDAPDTTHALYVKTTFAGGSPGTWTPK